MAFQSLSTTDRDTPASSHSEMKLANLCKRLCARPSKSQILKPSVSYASPWERNCPQLTDEGAEPGTSLSEPHGGRELPNDGGT